MGGVLFDLRDALRALLRDRAYAATSVLILGVTLGATTAMFSIVNGVLLQPLAYHEPGQLVWMREVWRQFSDHFATIEINERHFEYWREHARSFESLAEYIVLPANLTGAGEPAQVSVARANGTLFDVLQTRAAIGRTLTAADDPEGASGVAVISDALWRQRFAASPAVIGRQIVLDSKPYTVVGVLPASFRLPTRGRFTAGVEAFVPLRIDQGWVGDHNNEGIGRLRRGTTLEQARAELDVLQAQIAEIATREAHEPVTLASALTPLTDVVISRARTALWLLFAAIGAVLLIACSNLANLSVTRTLARLREAAIRSALGASQSRLVARALIEQLILSAAGGMLGIWMAKLSLAMFVRTAPIDLPRVEEVALDGRVLLFAAALALLTAIVVAAFPAWRLGGSDVQTTLRTGGAVAGDRGSMRTRAALLACQVGLSVVVLAVTSLLTTSFVRLLNADRGFATDGVLAVDIALPAGRYAAEPVRRDAYDRLIAAVQRVPGVQAVTTTSSLPMAGGGSVNGVVPEGAVGPRSLQPNANYRFVAPDFFRTVSLAIIRGRSFTDAERDPRRPAPAVISQMTAERLWPGQDAIGKRFSRGLEGEQGFEVVGIARDAHIVWLDRTPPLIVYIPYWWRSRTSLSLMVRTAGDPLATAPAIRRAIREIDPETAIAQPRSLDELADQSLAGRRYQMQLFVAFGAVALFIALVGVYAATSYNVSRRRREMNIRAALGARRSQVLGRVVRQSIAPIVAGGFAGALGALAAGGVVASLLFDVAPRDPFVIGTVVAAVAGIGALAALLAARQGLRLNPASALRDE